jgi:hypothetical protein
MASHEVKEQTAGALLEALWEWTPQVYNPKRMCSEPNRYYRHFREFMTKTEHLEGVYWEAILTLNKAAGDNFDYVEVGLGSDWEAVGKIVGQAAALLLAG